MLPELIENGLDAAARKQQQFLALAERFRNEKDPEAANRLGDELGRMVFGGWCRKLSAGGIYPKECGST
jgi:hypothetical protein